MATATVITTVDSAFTPINQGISSDQGTLERPTVDPHFTSHVSPGYVFKMRAWDTVVGAYVYWTSFGHPNTPAPTLNPVVGTTALQMNRPRTV